MILKWMKYLEAISPRKAFSFAISGGLKVVCALAKWVMPMGAIFSDLGDEVDDLTLLMREPIVLVLSVFIEW